MSLDLADRHVAVLGAGASGLAAAALALARGARVEAFDSGDEAALRPAAERFAALGAPLATGESALRPPRRYDLAVLSPGIALDQPIARAFSSASDELVGEIELAWRCGSAPVIGITGTNGKTTTTSLVAAMLQHAGLRAPAAGNIGDAYSEAVMPGREHDWIVLELSSFQLETITSFRPEIAVWLNFAPDHMDRYATLDDYRAAKLHLFDHLAPGAAVVRKAEDELGLAGRGFREITFSAFSDAADYVYADGHIRHPASGRSFDFRACVLDGKHNAENAMVALAVADLLKLPWDAVAPALREFRPPAHRCETVADHDGIRWVNDSKSTNLHSLRSALAGQEEPVVLIAGGKRKGLDYGEVADLVGEKARAVVCIGETAPDILAAWGDRVAPCLAARDLDEAVALARDCAAPRGTVLFSPGSSSFDMFTGYVARGAAFRRAVEALVAATPPAA
jgi:UDP-N-acetylmuramoylalanine--D-glutamate ligase